MNPTATAVAVSLPVGRDAEYDEAVFGEDHAEFIRRDGTLTTTMDVLVSGEDDGEVRRVSLTNSGRDPREIELTSYAEVVFKENDIDDVRTLAGLEKEYGTDTLKEAVEIVEAKRSTNPKRWMGYLIGTIKGIAENRTPT